MIAIAGTLIALTITGILANISVEAAKLTGFASEEAGFLHAINLGIINIRGLLLAGIIIGVLGVLDDITVSQSSIVQALKKANPQFTPSELYRRAMIVGKDHIASMVNTLVLVYTGAALPLLLLFIDNPHPFLEIVNYEIIADEVVRTLVGSIGLMLAVPITTLIAAVSNEKNKAQILYVITHCESCYNRLGIFTGRVDSKLTVEGHKHAEKMAEWLKRTTIDEAYISPLKRTRETVSHIAKYHPQMKIVVDERIIERDYGELSRKSKEKYKQDHPDLYPLYHRAYDVAPPGGESIKQVEKRVNNFLQEVMGKMRKEKINVLVVTHSNTMRPIRKYFEKLTNSEMMKLEYLRHIIFSYKVI